MTNIINYVKDVFCNKANIVNVNKPTNNEFNKKETMLQKRSTFDTFLNKKDEHLKSLKNITVYDIGKCFIEYVTDIESLIKMKKYFKKNYNVDCLSTKSMKTIIKSITTLRLIACKKILLFLTDKHGNIIKDEHGNTIEALESPYRSNLYFSKNICIDMTIYYDHLFVNHFNITNEQIIPNIKVEPPKCCYHCLNETANMKNCANCKVFSYCCEECQQADWKNHRTICTTYATNTPF